jgi:hypothetical protein
MKPKLWRVWAALALLVVVPPGISRAEDIGWPEAVDRLAGERSKAETCAASFKQYADAQQIPKGQLAYGAAKADYDAVIAGLVTALGEGETPKGLPSLEAELERGASALGQFCQMTSDVLPNSAGQKGVVEDIVKGATEPVIGALKEAVSFLFKYYFVEPDALKRDTIKTQLEAAKWPNFAEIKPSE